MNQTPIIGKVGNTPVHAATLIQVLRLSRANAGDDLEAQLAAATLIIDECAEVPSGKGSEVLDALTSTKVLEMATGTPPATESGTNPTMNP